MNRGSSFVKLLRHTADAAINDFVTTRRTPTIVALGSAAKCVSVSRAAQRSKQYCDRARLLAARPWLAPGHTPQRRKTVLRSDPFFVRPIIPASRVMKARIVHRNPKFCSESIVGLADVPVCIGNGRTVYPRHNLSLDWSGSFAELDRRARSTRVRQPVVIAERVEDKVLRRLTVDRGQMATQLLQPLPRNLPKSRLTAIEIGDPNWDRLLQGWRERQPQAMRSLATAMRSTDSASLVHTSLFINYVR